MQVCGNRLLCIWIQCTVVRFRPVLRLTNNHAAESFNSESIRI